MRVLERLAALVCGLGLASAALAQPAPDQVRIHDGMLKGVVDDGVASFKNIPFAAPPVGDLRWRAPQPPAPWSGVRPADDYGPACMQMSGATPVPPKVPQSEDCLTVNVFTPADHAGAKRPVMVWIYGGAFIQGAGRLYDGSHFAKDGVVLVTFNYRLGRLGFFTHPALTRTSRDGSLADFGLMDQITVLKWVRDNIAAFGGDPANVTIFGESAGGVSVNDLMVAPKARGLFAKAASESGFGRGSSRRAAAAEPGDVDFIRSLGVTGDDAAAAAAMRALPAAALSKPVSSLQDPGIPKPVLDGVVLTESPVEGFAKGDEAPVPYLLGGNSDEASLFPQTTVHPDVTLDALGADRGKVMAMFGAGDPVKAAAGYVTFSRVIEPTRYLARLHTKHGQPTYVYYFSYLPASMRATSLGVRHGGEIAYVFQNLRNEPRDRGALHIPAATPEDQAFSAAVHAYWVAFAKTGDPDSAGGVAWPMAEPGDNVLEFGSDGIVAHPNFDKAKLDLLAGRAGADAR